VEIARAYVAEFEAAGVGAGIIYGEMAPALRVTTLEAYAEGRIDVLVNVYVLTEGWDDPPTSCAILARGCGTPGLFLQMVGRILRPAPNKRDALLLDLRGVVHVHGRPDDDLVYSLDGWGIRPAEGQEGRRCVACGADLPDDLLLMECPSCGEPIAGAAKQEAPHVVNAELCKFDVIRRDSDEQRIERLSKWFQQAHARGYNPNQALHRYRGAYGVWPTTVIRKAAMERGG
jgi:superfamily II DNA or RNA helicase